MQTINPRREREGEEDGHTDRISETQIKRAGRQIDRHTDRPTNTQTDRETLSQEPKGDLVE